MENLNLILMLEGLIFFFFLKITNKKKRFFSCVPQRPGEFTLISPETTGEANLNPPVTLSWETPNPFGQGCTGNSAYQVFLSQVSSPDYFRQTSEQSMTVSSLSDGIWYWTVRSVNHYYIKQADDVFSFTVCFCCFFKSFFVFLKSNKVCNPVRPSTPTIIYPINGQYVPYSTFNLSFYGFGDWGMSCSPQVSSSFYQVCIVFILLIIFIKYFVYLFFICLFVYLFICLFVYLFIVVFLFRRLYAGHPASGVFFFFFKFLFKMSWIFFILVFWFFVFFLFVFFCCV